MSRGPQERLHPPEEQAEVEAGGGEDCFGAVSVAALEVVALHAVLGLDGPPPSPASRSL
jgi:hypothetical protein